MFNQIENMLLELKSMQSRTVNDETLWDVDDIAAYLKITKKYMLSKKLLDRSDFPPSYELPVSSHKNTRRWKAREVVAWVESFRSGNDE